VRACPGPQVIGLLTALVGFLVSSRGPGKTERASLFTVLMAVVRDIAIASPSPLKPSPRDHRIPHQKPASVHRHRR
jgi:hypothetical protein